MRKALKCASIYAGCGSLALGLVESGHELCFLVESEETSRDVLRAGFVGVELHKSEETLRSLPAETELLAASLSIGKAIRCLLMHAAHNAISVSTCYAAVSSSM